MRNVISSIFSFNRSVRVLHRVECCRKSPAAIVFNACPNYHNRLQLLIDCFKVSFEFLL